MADPVWVTPQGLLGTYTALYNIVPLSLQATPQYPATAVTYRLFNGLLPNGLSLSTIGVISGVPAFVQNIFESITEFTVVAIDNLGNSSTRTFSLEIVNPNPIWLVPTGYNGFLGTFTSFNLLETKIDAVQLYPATSVTYKLLSGKLPTGIKLSTIQNSTTKNITISQTIGGTSSYIVCANTVGNNTVGLSPGRPIKFSGTTFGGIIANRIYYVKQVLSDTIFTISAVPNGQQLILQAGSGSMAANVPATYSCLLTGTPTDIVSTQTYNFVIRATDNLGNVSDIGLSLTINGNLVPTFISDAGQLFETQDSNWIEYSVQYNNPDPNNQIYFTLAEGSLPPGLEINEAGLIRGYPDKPVVNTTLTAVNGIATATLYNNGVSEISCLSTDGFLSGRPIVFSGTTLGGIESGATYYIKQVLSLSQFTISTNINGPTVVLNDDAGLMDFTLPQTLQGNPTIKLYNFTLKINSNQGSSLRGFSIKVINQNAPVSQGGLGKIAGTRIPVIYNTRPFNYDIASDPTNYGFYVLPPATEYGLGETYPLTTNAPIGTVYSDNFFAFKILGHDFDNMDLEYVYNLPGELSVTGDSATGWITGIPTVSLNTISNYTFSAAVRKKSNPSIVSNFVNFSLIVANNIQSTIVWDTDSNLGSIYNGTQSIITLSATCDVPLQYSIVDGALPNNLELLPNGEIVGTVAYETTDDYLAKNTETIYTFTVNAFSPNNSTVITKTKTFTLTVVQEFIKPTDTLYIECAPSIGDRILIDNLLNDNSIIPYNYLYRPDDSNFGKANNVTYVHAYGINASNLDQYIAATQKNHYWRNITLGDIKTAYARDANNKIVYEVVYSEIVDNLVAPTVVTVYAGNFIEGKTYTIKTPGSTKWTEIGAANNNVGTVFVATGAGSGTGNASLVTKTESVSEEIYWPRFIDLNLGPWYTSITDIYTSYIYPVELDLVTQDNIFYITTQENQNLATNQGQPTFFTSLTPGYARSLYPNSLQNMRKRVEQNLGVDTNAALLPLWMTSQQRDGNTLGFTPAWVIAYTKLPTAVKVTATATNKIDNTITVTDASNIIVGGKIVFSGNTYGGLVASTVYYVVDVNTTTNKIKISRTQYGSVFVLDNSINTMTAIFDAVSYAEIIKYNIQNNWKDPAGNNLKLNLINFQLDRFTVNKSLTYDYDNTFTPAAWEHLPSATPVPNPLDSKNFNVLFPQKTILPNKPQLDM